ncbi:alpha-L-rhamnosidase [Dyadobacter sandarakinus]|uniref:alpha-L-rhamnosidase n=1 Tax=Dyadobacter sandarakinus TaxID=2747268 RepID=A0ABX7I183_9BACT|nr:alpha-L-rhamnosidase [Dyadobacter sandarakinus]QRQ99442.1 family 78 glycoside hydrolase catalytic domain [Dyadobacter sandarakinus]
MKTALLLLLFFSAAFVRAEGLTPSYLRCEYKVDPVTDERYPRLSWELTSSGNDQHQTAYQILAASSIAKLAAGRTDLWDSGRVPSAATFQVGYKGKPLASRQVCYWIVRSWDKNGVAGPWSKPASWEIGLLDKNEWKAQWIGLDMDHLGKGPKYHLPPAPYLRKEIRIKKGVKKARLYVTALGLYEFSINGKKTGDAHLTPGWTDYDKRVYYQVYDVTSDLKPGANALASQLSYGWYAGYLGYSLLVGNPVVRAFYGKVPVLKARLEVEYEDGKKEVTVTDQSWKVNQGALLESDLLNGETYDARLEHSGWQQPGFHDQSWKPAQVFPDKAGRKVEVYPGPPVKVTQMLAVKTILPRPGGSYIFDFAQNFAGIVRIQVRGEAGDTIRLRFGEKLHPDGRLMTENLRMARATDTYILKGDPKGETWEPKFTFHGFQYAEVSGLRNKPDHATLTGLVIGSDTPKTGTFETDNAMVNQLYSNIDWTQRANYIDIPTDCPQRDERIGWTGDAQVYVKSATFNRDAASFFTKWTVDLNDGQYENGAFPLYAPRPDLRKTDTFSPGWMEAGIICPYQIYRAYGDTTLIRKGWQNMVRFMDFLEKRSQGAYVFKENAFADIDPKGGYGDWLSFGKKTPPDMLASFYYYYCADLMKEMAAAIGQESDLKKFEKTAGEIRRAVLAHYSDGQGRFKCDSAAYGDGAGYVDGSLGFTGHTQTAYANAIYMNLLEGTARDRAGNNLVELLHQNNDKLGTGFLGAKPLLPALSATGHSDLAYRLFLSKAFPSWGFEVENGSTTIWERWDSYTKEDGFKYNAAMNSFSHYAFGAVCEWMFGNAAGIKATRAGFTEFDIQPEIAPDHPGRDGIRSLKASLRTMSGEIVSAWQKENGKLVMHVQVPVNTKARLFVPAADDTGILINGQQLSNAPGIHQVVREKDFVVVSVGSGNYTINIRR